MNANPHPSLSKATILVVDDVPENLKLLVGILAEQGYTVRLAPDGAFALEFARSTPPDLILLDIKMPSMNGYQVCERLKSDERTRDIPVVFISALSEADEKVQGFEVGGIDYITKPFQTSEVLARVKTHLILHRLHNHLEELVDERTTELRQANEQLGRAFSEIQDLKDQLYVENIYLQQEIKLEHNFDDIVGQSEALKQVLFNVEQLADTDTTVLILGETGTGKELIARALHHAGSRRKRPLVKVNCAALPSHLIESELFGHQKGAFTGAHARQIGRFGLAEGGTIFLDEIGEFPLELQAKLLRVLQDGEFEILGSPHTVKVDVRVIAATNRNLEEEVRAGRFRQDLFYRLNVYPLVVPPLRERPDDIPLLLQSFVHKFNKKLGKQISTIPQKALDALQQYSWPGNIRELENVIERAVITSRGSKLQLELPQGSPTSPEAENTLEEVEREYILQILRSKNWKVSGEKGAAKVLGLHPETLRSRMKKLGIRRAKF